ncbi:glutamate receptor 1.4 [Lactuca sativa]|uniref:glutamate receptor 1.4 n=1 Tax=Lactuca sativa TaxID=4236 RepID=UPI001C693663|nr:glutamate receptor 1.4 [Lactuca sativa]
MVHSEHSKSSLCLLILLCILDHALCAQYVPSQNKNQNININNDILISMGIILDMESPIGKSIHSCITMAISDFYALNHSYKTRIVLHTRDSEGDPVKALSAVDHLLKNAKVQAIIGPETYLPSKLLSLFADKAEVPIFSFASSSSRENPYLFQIKQDESIMAKSIAALVKSFNWRNVIFIHEDTEDGREILPYLAESLQDKNICISYRSAISASATHDSITQELRKIMTFHTTVIILHVSPSLASSLILNAKRLEMVSEGYAWILTEKTVDLLRSTNFTVIESSQGALGFRSYVPPSDRLHILTTKWHNFFYGNNFTSITKEVPVPALWAYDTIWALAESVEKVGVPHNGSMLLHEVLKIRFKGITGDFQLSEGKVLSNGYEIMNAVDNGERRVGYWTLSKGIRRAHPHINIDRLYPSLGSEAVVWPGGSTTAPKGWVLRATPSKKLKFGVQNINNFKYFMDIDHDVEKNVTTATGFSADVFYTCICALPYKVPYTFISFDNVSIDDLVQKVYNEEIDAVIGDSTILANRSEYVDFTATYTDLGVGTLVRIKKKDVWFFLKPLLDIYLCLVAIGSLIFNALVVWAIERMNPDSKVSRGTVSPTSFLLTILFAQRDNLSRNLSKFIMFIWFIVLLVLFTSYDAFLTSLLTVEQFESASERGIVGFHGGDFMKGVTVNNLHFENWNHRPYYSYEAYAHALSKDGEADAIVDEIPYIKMFLSRYPGDYALVSSQPITSGFAFIFQKGSPLVEDLSREIARIRLDGTLRSLENKWYENQIPLPSRNSTMPELSLTLDKLGGLFIISAATSTLALIISFFYLLHVMVTEGFNYLAIDGLEGF